MQTTETTWSFFTSDTFVRVLLGPIGCVAPETLVLTAEGPRRIDSLTQPSLVLSWDETVGQFRHVRASAAFLKGTDALYRVRTQHGEWRAAGHHRVLCADGKYRLVESLRQGQCVVRYSASPPQTTSWTRSQWSAGAPRWTRKAADSLASCGWLSHLCGRQPLLATAPGPGSAPSLPGALSPCRPAYSSAGHSHPDLPSGRQPTRDYLRQAVALLGARLRGAVEYVGRIGRSTPQYRRSSSSAGVCEPGSSLRVQSYFPHHISTVPNRYSREYTTETILAIEQEAEVSPYWDIQVPGPENYVTVDGTVHHNSGKSVTCVHEILRRATEQAPDANGVRKTRWGVVRNTVDQLRSTTLRTLFDWFPPGVWGVWKSSEKTFTIKVSLPDETTIDCEIMALALDHPDDVRKALSLELTGVFINEAREVAPEVIDGLLMRLRRFPSAKDGGPTWSGAILDSNMPDMDTWFFEQIENPPDNWKIFVQPPAILDREEYINQEGEEPEGEGWRDGTGEMWHTNPAADNLENLDPMYYPDTVQGKGKDFVNVYLRCKYGRSLSGLPVYEESFNPEFHFTKKPPKPIRSPDYPVVIGQDFGRTPAAVMMQRNVLGQIVVFREVTSQNMGIEKFVETKLKPVLAKEFAGCTFIMAPDPAGFFKQQIGEVSPVDLLKKAGFTCVKPATNDPDKRIQAVESVLGRQVDGKPMFVLYEDGCPTLSRGFRYLYRYKTKKTGESDARPEKNEASHPHDAAQYGVLVIEGGVTGGLGLHIPARREIKYASAGGWT